MIEEILLNKGLFEADWPHSDLSKTMIDVLSHRRNQMFDSERKRFFDELDGEIRQCGRYENRIKGLRRYCKEVQEEMRSKIKTLMDDTEMTLEEIYLDSIAYQLNLEINDGQIQDLNQYTKKYRNPADALKMIDTKIEIFFKDGGEKMDALDALYAIMEQVQKYVLNELDFGLEKFLIGDIWPISIGRGSQMPGGKRSDSQYHGWSDGYRDP